MAAYAVMAQNEAFQSNEEPELNGYPDMAIHLELEEADGDQPQSTKEDTSKMFPKILLSVSDVQRTLELLHDRCITRNLKAAGLGGVENEEAVYGQFNPEVKMLTGETLLLATVLYLTNDAKQAQYMVVLLGDGADPNQKDKTGKTALMHAAILGKDIMFKHLLQFNKTDVSICDNEGNTTLMHAAKHGRDAILKMLIKSLRRIRRRSIKKKRAVLLMDDDPYSTRNEAGDTARCLALRGGHLLCVQLLDEAKIERQKEINRRLASMANFRSSPSSHRTRRNVHKQASFDSILQLDAAHSDEEQLVDDTTESGSQNRKFEQLGRYKSNPELNALLDEQGDSSANSSRPPSGTPDRENAKQVQQRPATSPPDDSFKTGDGIAATLASKLRTRRAVYIQSKQEMLRTIRSPSPVQFNLNSDDSSIGDASSLISSHDSFPNIPERASIGTRIKNFFYRRSTGTSSLKHSHTNVMGRSFDDEPVLPALAGSLSHSRSDTFSMHGSLGGRLSGPPAPARSIFTQRASQSPPMILEPSMLAQQQQVVDMLGNLSKVSNDNRSKNSLPPINRYDHVQESRSRNASMQFQDKLNKPAGLKVVDQDFIDPSQLEIFSDPVIKPFNASDYNLLD